jgi:signal transduction histidine kinase
MTSLGIPTQVDVIGKVRRVSPSIEYAVYRVAQEALSNAARHAAVDEVSIQVALSDDALTLTVTDRGIGFVPHRVEAENGTHGLTSMRDRANEIGADLQIQTSPGEGTSVCLAVPVRPTLVDRP